MENVRKLIEEYLDERIDALIDPYSEPDQVILEDFRSWCNGMGKPLLNLTPEDILDYIKRPFVTGGEDITTAFILKRILCIRKFCDFLISRGMMKSNPVDHGWVLNKLGEMILEEEEDGE